MDKKNYALDIFITFGKNNFEQLLKSFLYLMLLLRLLSCFSRVRLCVTPETAAHQAPPSLGFSRQEHWSGFCHFLLQCRKMKVTMLSRVQLLATPWTAAYHAPPSMGFSRQEYWSGFPLPSPFKNGIQIPKVRISF